MADETKTRTPSEQDGASVSEVNTESVDAAMDEALDQGFVGLDVDPTPNENYTFEGAVEGAPTPETDDEQAAVVAEHRRGLLRGRGAERSAPGRARAAERGAGRGRGATRGR